ncbi:MAG TPA: hypothetical protein VJH37_00185, partial [Candidatus Nanoarchaeia archaeon]|nr:hypothetical protein [Candidatus Nanoarchaeia archaeon]
MAKATFFHEKSRSYLTVTRERGIRAKEILKVGKPEIISEEEFLVPSSNGKDKYRVIHLDSWSCACPDFISRCREVGLHC